MMDIFRWNLNGDREMLRSQDARYHERYEMALYSEYDSPNFSLNESLSKEDVKQLLIHKLSMKQQNDAVREQKHKAELARLCQSTNSGINLFRREEETYESVEYLNRNSEFYLPFSSFPWIFGRAWLE